MKITATFRECGRSSGGSAADARFLRVWLREQMKKALRLALATVLSVTALYLSAEIETAGTIEATLGVEPKTWHVSPMSAMKRPPAPSG